MKELSFLAAALVLPIALIGCTETVPTAAESNPVEERTTLTSLLSEEGAQVIAEGLSSHFGSENLAKGESFIAPFSAGENWGIANFSGGALELAGFSTELDENDFYRENKDGTVTVHVASNDAVAEYFEQLFDSSAPSLSGSPARFSANYTGAVVEIPLPDGVIIRFINLNSPKTRALSVHGNGFVYDADGTAYQLSMAITETPSGNRRSTFEVK